MDMQTRLATEGIADSRCLGRRLELLQGQLIRAIAYLAANDTVALCRISDEITAVATTVREPMAHSGRTEAAIQPDAPLIPSRGLRLTAALVRKLRNAIQMRKRFLASEAEFYTLADLPVPPAEPIS